MNTHTNTIEVTCIICPNGCPMQVEVEDQEVVEVTGNGCMRGYAYAQREIMSPTRTFTSTLEVNGGMEKRVSVKTKSEIPKNKLMECAKALKGMKVNAPITIGDVLISNVVKTGVDLVATMNVPKKQ